MLKRSVCTDHLETEWTQVWQRLQTAYQLETHIKLSCCEPFSFYICIKVCSFQCFKSTWVYQSTKASFKQLKLQNKMHLSANNKCTECSFFHCHDNSVLTMGEDELCSTMVSGSRLLSILSCSWWSKAKPAAMSLGTRSVSCKTHVQLCNSYILNLLYILMWFLYWLNLSRLKNVEKMLLTEKNLLKSWAMLENAARLLSSCGRQQHSSRSLLSHTLTARERAVEKNWDLPLLSMSRTPSGSMAGGCGRESPSGSNTNSTPNAVNSKMIQLLWEQKWKMLSYYNLLDN